MKKYFFLYLLLLESLSSKAQGVNNLWLMGYQSWAGQPFGGINIDFQTGVPIAIYEQRTMNFNCTNGVICDSVGNLLFCTNGIYIANRDLDTMQNGGGLNPSTYTTIRDSMGLSLDQANLIIPIPGQVQKYYLFHCTCDDYGASYCSRFLYYSIIDISQDSGRGSVIQKNIILLDDSLVTGRMSACRHANGRDWWIIIHKFNSITYFKFLIAPQGVLGPYTQDIGVVRNVGRGQSCFSPDGNSFAYYEPDLNDLDILEFDRCTGNFSNLVHVDINDSAFVGGVSFSSNSEVLYVSSEKYVYQFDLTAANISASMQIVAVWDGYYSPNPPLATLFYTALLAPDGKIYIICGNATIDIHVIDFPNTVGIGCGVCQHCIPLPAFNAFTIPNHPNYFLGREIGSACDTITGIEAEQRESLSLKVFPNPVFEDKVTFYFDGNPEISYISIYDEHGQIVTSSSLPQWSSIKSFSGLCLKQGLYIAVLNSENIQHTSKFIVK